MSPGHVVSRGTLSLGQVVSGADSLRGRLSRGILSPGHIVSGADCLGAHCLGAHCLGADCLGAPCPPTKILKEELFNQRIRIAKTRKSKPWTINQLKQVLKHLKSGKSRDPHGLINELFKPEVSGTDFQASFLIMANKIKDEVFIPEFMQYANVVSIYKGKGEKTDLANDRGIFLVNIFRSIIMKLVYQDKYDIVDKNMSDSNVGARKNKNVRNHIFVINGVINDVINRKEESVDIQILDYKQCFDSLWLIESIND